MDTFMHVLQQVGHWVVVGLIWALCLAGVGLSGLSISGTWLVTAAALLAFFVKTGPFPGIWTLILFVLISAAVEGVEAVAGAWGVTRRGGSRLAGLAAVIGGILGLFIGGVIPIPLVGSLIGMTVCSFGLVYLVEHRRLRKSNEAAGIAWGAVIARVLVIIVKVGVTIGMAVALLAGSILFRVRAGDEPRQVAGIRVVSLAPNVTEIICAIGADEFLVARSSACDYPADRLADIPVVGGFGTPSVEMLVSVKPTIVLEVDLEDEALKQQLEDLGIRRERIACRTLDDIPAAVRRVGELTDRQQAAEGIAGEFESHLAILRERAAGVTDRPTVYAEIWHDPLMTAGRNTFLSQLIHLAGGKNIGDEADEEYFRVSSEWVISRDPDIVICTYMSESMDVQEKVRKRPGWQNVKAIRDGAICAGMDNDTILRPGPRALQGAEALRLCIAEHRTR